MHGTDARGSLIEAPPPAPAGGIDPIAASALHPTTADLVDRFSAALKAKLQRAERKYGYTDNWTATDWMDQCREELVRHVGKGDPLDVAAFCAFLWHHGESTCK